MNLRIVGHPLKRMAERGISVEDIKAVLTGYHTSRPGQDGSICYEGEVGGRTLKVWLLFPMDPEKSDKALIMKSAAWKDN